MNLAALKVLGAVFAVAAIGVLVGFNKSLFDLGIPEVKVIVSAGVTAVLVFVAAYLSPMVPGIGVKPPVE